MAGETVGTDFLVKYDGNTIAGKSDATFDFSRSVNDLAPTQGTGAQFRRRLTGLKDVSLDVDALWIANSTALNGFKPTVTVSPSQEDPPALENVSEVSLTLNRELVEFSNSSNAQYIARGASTLGATAEFTVDISASGFYSSDSASHQLVTAWESTDGTVDVEVALPGGNTSFSSTWVVESFDPTVPSADASEATFSVSSTGTISETINSDLSTGLDTLLKEMFKSDPGKLTAIGETGNTGDVRFSGPVLPSEIEITIPVEGSEDGVNTSATFEAAGEFTIEEAS